jgi:alpha-ketoglutarate-dependent taurine dioxygenase
MPSFAITPLTDHTGAEVIGLDFTQPIDIETRAALNRAFAERHVLVMRDQHFTPEQFKAAAQLFGELQPSCIRPILTMTWPSAATSTASC